MGIPLGGTCLADQADGRETWRLSYRIPRGWVSDREGAGKRALSALLMPEGTNLDSAEAVITIAFQGKRTSPFRQPSLKGFFMAEMRKLLLVFPDLKSESWKPSSLEATSLDVASLEISGVTPGPLRVVMIDAGDGYYSIHLSVRKHEDLERPDVRTFFESLLLLGPIMEGHEGS